jgi:asparagine synthetase B (glutamine-hydrolysing)
VSLLTAFGMSGRRQAPIGEIRHEYGTPGNVWNLTGTAGGRTVQGPVYESGRPMSPARAGAASRIQLTGWVDLGASRPRAGEAALVTLQRLLDEGGPPAVRRLRGDFVLAHQTPGGELRLYRGASSMTPLFWRADGDAFCWATDPAHLLAGASPSLSDVDIDQLPMVISEMGMPYDRSWFASVRRLPNGCCLSLRGREPVVEPFDQLVPMTEVPQHLPEAADELVRRLGRACGYLGSAGQRALLLLSGGVDSAALACEVRRQGAAATGLHFTLESFPGFDEDRDAAAAVAHTYGMPFVPYDMAKHVRRDGDYLQQATGLGLPQTHVPQPGPAIAAEQAEADQATFVLSGLFSDQILADDRFRERFEVAGASMLNPLVAGEPFWQAITGLVSTTFSASGRPSALSYLRDVLSAAPTLALPGREVMVRAFGFTRDAEERVAEAIRSSVSRARQELGGALGGRRPHLPRGITSLFLLNEGCNTPNLQAAWLNTYLPRRLIFTTPFADRDVVEYALALPARYRTGFGYGTTVDKLALRLGYARHGVPPRVCQRMHQARIDAIPAVFVNQNVRACRELLGPDSRLCELGVVDRQFAERLNPRQAHRNGEKIARLSAIELWLRRLAS